MRSIWVVPLLGLYGCGLSSQHVTVGEDNRAGSTSTAGAGGLGGDAGADAAAPDTDAGAAGGEEQTGGTGGSSPAAGSGNQMTAGGVGGASSGPGGSGGAGGTGVGGSSSGSAGTGAPAGGAAGVGEVDPECMGAISIEGPLQIYAGGETEELVGHVSGDLTLYATTKSLRQLRCLSSVGGSLRVDTASGVTNLDGLGRLRSVGGGISIENTDLTNIRGLAALDSVAVAGLTIRNNRRLEDLTGLEGLTFPDGIVTISDNALLENIDGLSHLTGLGTDILITNNPALLSVAGLRGLRGVTGSLSIIDNRSLRELTGLEGMSEIPNVLSISNNDVLVSLAALSGLTAAGELNLYGNVRLSGLMGLENLRKLSRFVLGYHPLVSSLAPLDGLESIALEGSIYDNPLLSVCEAEAFLVRCGTPSISLGENGPCE